MRPSASTTGHVTLTAILAEGANNLLIVKLHVRETFGPLLEELFPFDSAYQSCSGNLHKQESFGDVARPHVYLSAVEMGQDKAVLHTNISLNISYKSREAAGQKHFRRTV